VPFQLFDHCRTEVDVSPVNIVVAEEVRCDVLPGASTKVKHSEFSLGFSDFVDPHDRLDASCD
jgi:hypothetical protein